MKNHSILALAAVIASGLLSACSHQQVATVVPEAVAVEVPKVAATIPAAQPYRHVVKSAVPIKPAPMPVTVAAPAVQPVVVPVPVIPAAQPLANAMPQVRAKGTYRGTVPVDTRLRYQYQQ